MRLRHAVPADLDRLAYLEAVSYPADQGAGKEQIQKRMTVFPNHFWLLEEEGEVQAFVNGMVTEERDLTDAMYERAQSHDPKGAWQMIFSVVTAPEQRQKGYASTLLRWMLEEAREQGRAGVVLTCRERLIPFYSSFGFVNEGVSVSTHGDVVWYQMRHTF